METVAPGGALDVAPISHSRGAKKSAKPRGERNAHGAVLQAAIQLLMDGKTRTAAQIEEDAFAAGLISKTPASTVDATLLEYIARCQRRGRKPVILETPQRTFRLNEPPDDWPALPITPLPPLTKAQQEIVDRLRATSQNDTDGSAFELAVCDAFNALHFAATHMGGWDAPDGYIDAQLGTLGYRVMLECKSGHALHSDAAFESAKYRETYHAQYCVIVGTNTVDDQETLQEMHNHGVAAWSVDDFEILFRLGADALELRSFFEGGVVAADAIMDLQWNRSHGEGKRAHIVAEIVQDSGWAMQCAAVQAGPPQNAPVLNVDAAMMLVDQALLAKGCKVSCTRDQVQAAFDYLTSPLVNAAVWNENRTGIVIRRPQP